MSLDPSHLATQTHTHLVAATTAHRKLQYVPTGQTRADSYLGVFCTQMFLPLAKTSEQVGRTTTL